MAMARPFRSVVELSAISAMVLGPTNPLPSPWLIRTRARRRGVVANAYRNRETASHKRPTWSGSFRPMRSAIRPKNRLAGAWTTEKSPTIIPVCSKSAPTCCAYSAMTGTSAFESIVPSMVAASRLRVRRAAIMRGTRATLKKMSRHDSPNAADLRRSPERLRRREGSIIRADPSRGRFERARGHSRETPGTWRGDRGAEDRAGRLCPGTRWHRTQDPLRFLQLDGPEAPVRTGAAAHGRLPAAARNPRRRPGRDLDVQEPASDLGRPPRPRDDGAGPRAHDGG